MIDSPNKENTPVWGSEDQCEVFKIHPQKLERIQNSLLPGKVLSRMGRIFKILSDPTRLRIIVALSKEELCVCDISTFVRQSISSVSHHLKALRDLNLVKFHRQGKMIYYTLADPHINSLITLAQEHAQEEIVQQFTHLSFQEQPTLIEKGE
ncbi:MAG: ArsR/SmtB family transcription factor [bacterium]